MTDLVRMIIALERIADALEAQRPIAQACPLLTALRGEFGNSPFTTKEVLERSERLANEAELRGQRVPDLPHELAVSKITSPQALGRWLADNPRIERASSERGSAVWAVVS